MHSAINEFFMNIKFLSWGHKSIIKPGSRPKPSDMPHTCSIGERSGDLAGQGRVITWKFRKKFGGEWYSMTAAAFSCREMGFLKILLLAVWILLINGSKLDNLLLLLPKANWRKKLIQQRNYNWTLNWFNWNFHRIELCSFNSIYIPNWM